MTSSLSRPIHALKSTATNPLFTALLLWTLTRAPTHIREKLLRPFRDNSLSKNASGRVAKFVVVLKVLLVYGLAKRVNQALNSLALNEWRLSKRGTEWRFGGGKEEVVVITGGASGFGYEMVKGFASMAKVVVIDVVEVPKEVRELPDVYCYKCDLSNLEGIVSCAATIRDQHGNPTVLINNAGISTGMQLSLLDTKIASLEKIFKVNLLSHFVLIREFLPGMMEAGKGHVVTLASCASFRGSPGLVDYSCTKAGALALHEGLRAELISMYPGNHRIRTTSVHPSWHSTGIVAPYKSHIEAAGIKLDPASNVANAIIEQVVNDRSGQLMIPESVWFAQYMRSAPWWFRDVKTGYVVKFLAATGY